MNTSLMVVLTINPDPLNNFQRSLLIKFKAKVSQGTRELYAKVCIGNK